MYFISDYSASMLPKGATAQAWSAKRCNWNPRAVAQAWRRAGKPVEWWVDTKDGRTIVVQTPSIDRRYKTAYVQNGTLFAGANLRKWRKGRLASFAAVR